MNAPVNINTLIKQYGPNPLEFQLHLVPYDHPLLHQPKHNLILPPRPELTFTPEHIVWLNLLEERLIERCQELNGVGLAAPQVGLDMAAYVAPWLGRLKLFLNPFINSSATRSLESREGCLSCPGFTRNVSRRVKINFRALHLEGQGEVKLLKQGTFDVWDDVGNIHQHEHDHLWGKVIYRNPSTGAYYVER